MEVEAELDDEDEAEPEAGGGLAEEGDEGDDAVERAAFAEGGEDAEGEGDGEGEGEADEAEGEGDGDAVADEFGDGGAEEVGAAEVAVGGVGDPVERIGLGAGG